MTKSKTSGTIFDKYSITLADLVALGAATSGTITLEAALPAGSVITNTLVKPTTALAGPSLSAATARVTTTSPTKTFGTAYDVFQAVGDTVHSYDGASQFTGIAATPALLLSMTSTGANFSALTAGAIDVYFEYETAI